MFNEQRDSSALHSVNTIPYVTARTYTIAKRLQSNTLVRKRKNLVDYHIEMLNVSYIFGHKIESSIHSCSICLRQWHDRQLFALFLPEYLLVLSCCDR